jgi:hypothetical protein
MGLHRPSVVNEGSTTSICGKAQDSVFAEAPGLQAHGPSHPGGHTQLGSGTGYGFWYRLSCTSRATNYLGGLGLALRGGGFSGSPGLQHWQVASQCWE